MTDLAVIIVSFNTRALLAQALASLQKTLGSGDHRARILVVDNNSQDGSPAMVREQFPGVELLEPGENLGFAGGNNLALRELGFGERGDGERPAFVWLLNSDTEVMDDAPRRLVHHLRTHPTVGAAGPALQYGDGRFQHAAFAFPGLAQIAMDLFPAPARLLESRVNGRYPRSCWQGHRPFAVDMLLGAAMMVRGATIEQVGLLDEGYYMYAEELDWCRRMDDAGWAVHAVPDTTVVHHSGQSTGQIRDRMYVALWRSRLRYYEKWESPAYVGMVRMLLRLGMAWQRYRMGREISPDERGKRLAAYREIAAL